MIPIDEPVLIRAKNKKSVVEVERYQRDDDEILVSTLWRNGEFSITCTSLKEARFLQEMFNQKDPVEVNLNYFEDWEMLGTFDGISVDFLGDSEDITEAQEREDDFAYWSWLEENGWEHIDTEYFIYGAVEYVKED